MPTLKRLATVLLLPFLGLTAYAMWQDGYIGLFMHQFSRPAGWQVLADLVIALLMMLYFIVPDAKKHNRNVWGWVLFTFVAGSIGPLFYFATQSADNAHHGE